MKNIILVSLISLLSIGVFAQEKTNDPKCYHVSTYKADLMTNQSDTSTVVKVLDKNENLTAYGNKKSGLVWVKVVDSKVFGYLATKDIKPGKAEVRHTRYRTGAVCKDGSSSSATGRGACSHHGGVSRWKYGSRSSVSINTNSSCN